MREGSCTQVKDLVMVDVTIACSYRVMLAASCDYEVMNMYPSDKHGRVRCARWMLTASVIISCSMYSPAAFDTDC